MNGLPGCFGWSSDEPLELLDLLFDCLERFSQELSLGSTKYLCFRIGIFNGGRIDPEVAIIKALASLSDKSPLVFFQCGDDLWRLGGLQLRQIKVSLGLFIE